MTTTLLDRPTPIADDATRREFIAGGLGLGALILAGCGDDDESGGSNPPSAEGFPRTVQHALGATEVPRPPERVVSLVSQSDLGWILVLGVTPVGYGANNPYPFSYYQQAETLDGVTFLPWGGEVIPDLEAVAALRPDLITGNTGRLEDAYEKLSQTAPTIAFEGNSLAEIGRPFA